MIIGNKRGDKIQIKTASNMGNSLEFVNNSDTLLQLGTNGKIIGNKNAFADVTDPAQLVFKNYSDQVSSFKGILGSNTVLVSSQNGEYSSIQAAIDSIKNGTNAGKDVDVYRGVYNENIFVYDGINLRGIDNVQCILEQGPGTSTAITLRNKYYEYIQDFSLSHAKFPGTVTNVYSGASKKHVTYLRQNNPIFADPSSVLDDLDGKFFIIYDKDGSVAVWFDRTGATAQPAAGANRYLKVPISGLAKNQIDNTIGTVIGADAQFNIVYVLLQNTNSEGMLIHNVDDAFYGNSLQGTLQTNFYVISNPQSNNQTLEKFTTTIDFTGLTAGSFNVGVPNDPKIIMYSSNYQLQLFYFNYDSQHNANSYSLFGANIYEVAVSPGDSIAQIMEKFVRVAYANGNVFLIGDSPLLPRMQVEGNSTIKNLSFSGDTYDYATAIAPIVDLSSSGNQYADKVYMQDTIIRIKSGNTAGIKGCGVNCQTQLIEVYVYQPDSSQNGLNGNALDLYGGKLWAKNIFARDIKCNSIVKINSGKIKLNCLQLQSTVAVNNGVEVVGGDSEVCSLFINNEGQIQNGIHINTETFIFQVQSGYIHGVVNDILVDNALVGTSAGNLYIAAHFSINKLNSPVGWLENTKSIMQIVSKQGVEDYGVKFIGEVHVGNELRPSQVVVGEGDINTTNMKVFQYNGSTYADITAVAQNPLDSPFALFPNTNAGTIVYIGNTLNKFFGIKVFDITTVLTGNTGSPTQEISTFRILNNNISDNFFDGQYFIIYDQNGSVAFWFDVDNTGTPEPAHGAVRSIKIATLTNNMSDSDAADAIAIAVAADSQFQAVSDNISTVTITSVTTGSRQDIFLTATLRNEAVGAVIQQGSEYNVLTEYWSGFAWTPFNTLSSQTFYPYDQYASQFLERTQTEQIRFDLSIGNNWALTSVNGTNAYWVRLRIQQNITQVPVLQQIKLHTNRTQINQDGFIERFGYSEVKKHIALDERMQYNLSTPATTNVTLDTGFVLSIPLSNFNSTQNLGFCQKFAIPHYINTSREMVAKIKYSILGTGTGNIEFTFKYKLVREDITYQAQPFQTQKQIVTIASNQENVVKYIDFIMYIPDALPDEDVILAISRNADVSNPRDTLGEAIVIGEMQLNAWFWG